jgi:hypothetical protein
VERRNDTYAARIRPFTPKNTQSGLGEGYSATQGLNLSSELSQIVQDVKEIICIDVLQLQSLASAADEEIEHLVRCNEHLCCQISDCRVSESNLKKEIESCRETIKLLNDTEMSETSRVITQQVNVKMEMVISNSRVFKILFLESILLARYTYAVHTDPVATGKLTP